MPTAHAKDDSLPERPEKALRKLERDGHLDTASDGGGKFGARRPLQRAATANRTDSLGALGGRGKTCARKSNNLWSTRLNLAFTSSNGRSFASVPKGISSSTAVWCAAQNTKTTTQV